MRVNEFNNDQRGSMILGGDEFTTKNLLWPLTALGPTVTDLGHRQGFRAARAKWAFDHL